MQSRGVQFGLANVAEQSSYGVQLGLVGIVSRELKGLQVAPVCYAKEGNYVQVGILTIRGAGPWYTRITPLLGFHKERLPKL